MKITAIMATCGRHYCSERSLSLFLNQKYVDKHLLIYQNSEVIQTLNPNIQPGIVTLVNNNIDPETKLPFKSLGAIYSDALNYIPNDADVIVFWDDDDIFLEDHLSEGVKGLIRGGKTAYKPAWSFFKNCDGIEYAQNTLEPSIFVKSDHIRSFGFFPSTTDQHLKWLNPLINSDDIYIDEDGESTLIYNWGDTFDIYRTSANADNPNHFEEYRKHSQDHGDKIISPIDISEFV